ncbi:MAG: N-acetyl-gamma-glutamyl-phosphate reductase [Planctomycetota bacterium]
MIRVGVVGGTGYTGLELIKLLLRHPEVSISLLTSRDESMPDVGQVHPELTRRLETRFSILDVTRLEDKIDCAFCCLPHAASAEVIRSLVDTGIRIIDFSADYRLNDVETFEQLYLVKHPDPERVGKVSYGIPEFFRDQIKDAQLVANPGCFPSSALLPLAPLLAENLILSNPIIVDAKTGVSGAGRKANLKFHFPECNESVMAYSVGKHRHRPEIEQILQRFTGHESKIFFTPHLISMNRGILSTIYLRPEKGVSVDTIRSHLLSFYQHEPFIRIVDRPPATKDVSHTNFCDIHVAEDRGMIVILSALDNLIKGASGAAVQNFNVMYQFPETTALI